MSSIGKNNGIIKQELLLGKEIGKFGKDITSKQNAVDLAKVMPGSELVYQGKDGDWTVSELKQEGLVYGVDDLSKKDKSEISLNTAKLKEKGISYPVISFVEEEAPEQIKEKVASDPKTKKVALEVLANDDNPNIRAIVGANSSTPVPIIRALAKDENIYHDGDPFVNTYLTSKDIQQGVASNPNTPSDILKQLASDDIQMVRANVAQNPNTTIETLKTLSYDLDASVRAEVGVNPKTPPEILKQLAKDPSAFVRGGVASNPKIPPEALIQLAKDPDDNIKSSVASNPSLPKNILKELSKSADPNVKLGVYLNPNCPKEIKKELEPILGKAVDSGNVEYYAPAIDEKGKPVLSLDGNQIFVKIDLKGNPILDKDGNLQFR